MGRSADAAARRAAPLTNFCSPALPEPVEYYVEAAGVKSKTYKLDVVDLPGIKNIKVTYHYPSWLGLKDAVEDPGGDLRAVAGTVAELTIETDRPLKNGVIEMDDGSHIALEADSRRNIADRESADRERRHVSLRGQRAGRERPA